MVGIVVAIGATLARSVWFFAVGPEARAIAALPDPQAATPQTAFNVDEIAKANLFGDPSTATQRTEQTDLDDTPDTRLNLELVAVYQAEDPEQSLAVIGAGGRGQEAYRIGDAIPGNARLVAIHRGQVVISRDGIRERLRFDEDSANVQTAFEATDGVPPDMPRMPAVAPLPARSSAPPPRADARQVVHDYRDRLAEDPRAALRDLGVTAVSETDAQGYRVGTLANAPQLAHTGLQSGDVILSVNGRPVGNLHQDRTRLDEAMAAGSVRLEIQRGERRFYVRASLP